MHSNWSTYSTLQAWADFAQDHGLNSDDSLALPMDIDDINFPHLMDEEYKIVIFLLPQSDGGILKLYSALIFDVIKFAFSKPLIFHYNLQGTPTEVFFLPQVTQKLGLGRIQSHHIYATDVAGNDVAIIAVPLSYYTTLPNPIFPKPFAIHRIGYWPPQVPPHRPTSLPMSVPAPTSSLHISALPTHCSCCPSQSSLCPCMIPLFPN